MRKGTFFQAGQCAGIHNSDKTLWLWVKYKLEIIVEQSENTVKLGTFLENTVKIVSILIFRAHCLGCLSQSFFPASAPLPPRENSPSRRD